MTTVSTTPTSTASPKSGIISFATANDVFAALSGGGSISVEEYPSGEITEAAKRAERRDDEGDGVGALVLSLSADRVDGTPIDTVWFHPDQDDRLAVIHRARAALDAAEAALEAVGYVDKAHLINTDWRTPQQRDRNAFELGRDYGAGASA